MDLNNNEICDSDEQTAEEEQAAATELAKSATMGQFMATYNTNGGYTYTYKEDNYAVSGDTVKKELAEPQKIQLDQAVGTKKTTMPWADAMYFNTAEKTAIGYCEGLSDRNERMCSGYGLWDVEIPITYDSFYVKTPSDWLMEYIGKVPSEVKELYRFEETGQQVTGVVFVEEGKTIMLDIDPITGIVVRATVDENGFVTEYKYTNIKAGAGQVMHEYKNPPVKPELEGDNLPAVTEDLGTEAVVE